jgi:hypothetical protein
VKQCSGGAQWRLPPARKRKAGGVHAGAAERLALAAIGMEAEFSLLVDGRPARPERVFGTPRAFIRQALMHRTGTSYHLPTGGAVYFDTGVIEVATPPVEIERGCAARAGRSLWEAILFLRHELDAWERRTHRDVRLIGFSAHYNISFDEPAAADGVERDVEKLALLLAHVLPAPVMLLATNRRSTGVGVRPRGSRIEVTVDFTPSASLMIATGTLITGITRAVMAWPSYDLGVLEASGLPVLQEFQPIPHTSRHGWLAHESSYPASPFQADIDAPLWRVQDGRRMSLREIAGRTAQRFWPAIRQLADPFTLRLIGAVLAGRAPSLLDLPDRPEAYEDVGRLCRWEDLFPERALPRSRYERVLIHAIRGERLRMHGRWYTPVGMRGWSQVVFRREGAPHTHTFPLDYLLRHLNRWGG